MEDFITRPIGEKFDYDGVTLEVVEEGEITCKGCYFIDSKSCLTGETQDVAGYCFSSVRKDKKDVIFKKLE